MLRSTALLVAFVALCLPVLASEPGNPLDCSDWVFLEPGLSCQTLIPSPCTHETCSRGQSVGIANEGGMFYLRYVLQDVYCPTPVGDYGVLRVELVRIDSEGDRVVGYIAERCGPIGDRNVDRLRGVEPECLGGCDLGNTGPFLTFNDKTGTLFLPAESFCYPGTSTCAYTQEQADGRWLMAIEGFTTAFDILQTYTPVAGPISFRVPYMPEGFQYADYFDTYWGDLATVGDWSQAQPLQCAYPATVPSVGDYLTVEDTLPTPASGQGYYYVTAVNYQGQRRYGRQSNGGALTGRDPAVLPVCN